MNGNPYQSSAVSRSLRRIEARWNLSIALAAATTGLVCIVTVTLFVMLLGPSSVIDLVLLQRWLNWNVSIPILLTVISLLLAIVGCQLALRRMTGAAVMLTLIAMSVYLAGWTCVLIFSR